MASVCRQAREVGPRAARQGTLPVPRAGLKTRGAHHSVVSFVICCIAAIGSSVSAWALEAAESATWPGPNERPHCSLPHLILCRGRLGGSPRVCGAAKSLEGLPKEVRAASCVALPRQRAVALADGGTSTMCAGGALRRRSSHCSALRLPTASGRSLRRLRDRCNALSCVSCVTACSPAIA